MSLRLGKAPAAPDKRDLKLETYVDTTVLPSLPKSFGYDAIVPKTAWGMEGNDEWGDCVWAGAAHEHMLLTAIQSKDRPSPTMRQFTTANTLAAYSGCTGFNANAGPPGDNPTDQGTDVHQAMAYRQKTGVKDAHGTVHKIGAYLNVALADVRYAVYLFGACGMGFNFPQSAMDQFNEGVEWSVVKGSPIEGGHYVPIVSVQSGYTVKVVTWGALQAATWSFVAAYADEFWAYVSPDDLAGTTGLSARGFNTQQLAADLAAL